MERLLAFWRNRRFFKFRKFCAKKEQVFTRLNMYANRNDSESIKLDCLFVSRK